MQATFNLTSDSYLIGKAPQHVEQEDLFNYFLYAYELTWRNMKDKTVEARREKIDAVARNILLNYETMETDRQWWLFHLISYNQLLADTDFEYMKNTVNYLLGKFERIPTSLLEFYVNEIQFILYNDNILSLSARPTELQNLQSSLSETDHYLVHFLNYQETAVSIFKKYLTEEDCNEDFIRNVVILSPELTAKYSSYWDAVYEALTVFLLTLIDMFAPSELLEGLAEEEVSQYYVTLMTSQLTNLTDNKDALEKIIVELLPIVMETREIERA